MVIELSSEDVDCTAPSVTGDAHPLTCRLLTMYRHEVAANPAVCRFTVIVVAVTVDDVIVGALSGAAIAAGAEIPTCIKPAAITATIDRAILRRRAKRNMRWEF